MVEESAKSLATYSRRCWVCVSNGMTKRASLQELSGRGRLTSEMRRMFSLRSFSEKPKSLFRPNRTLSPSRR
jgi:hypothetical protein